MKDELVNAAREEYVRRLLHPVPPKNGPDMADEMADAYREGFLDCLTLLIKHGFIHWVILDHITKRVFGWFISEVNPVKLDRIRPLIVYSFVLS